MKFMKIVMTVVAGMAMAMTAEATVSPVAGNIVTVGCAADAPTGASVYSVNSAILNGSATDSLTLPTGVAAGNACGVALNALSGVTCATGKTWVLGNGSPVNVTIDNSGYSLQQFTFTCQ
jgi:hypothetical protein